MACAAPRQPACPCHPARQLAAFGLWAIAAAAMLVASPAGGQVRAEHDHPLVTPGALLVLPIELDASGVAPVVVLARHDWTGPIQARTAWLVRRPPERPTTLERWLGAGGDWRTLPRQHDEAGRGEGRWVALIEVPEQVRGGSLWLEDQRLEPLWAQREPVDAEPLRPIAARAAPIDARPALREAVATLAADPLRAWRARLVDALLPGERPAAAPLENPIHEALAARATAEWLIGLDRLARADEALAERVLARLLGVVAFEASVRAPGWIADEGELLELRALLTDPRLPPRSFTMRTELWLERQPQTLSWVRDDWRPSARGVLATIALANATDRTLASWVASVQGGAEPVALPPWEVRELAAPVSEGRGVQLVVGGRPTGVSLLGMPLAMTPPGLALAPGPEWTLDELAGNGSPRRPLRLAALLFRAAPEVGDDQTALVRRDRRIGPLRLHIERRTAESPGESAEPGVLRVWLGPGGEAGHVLRIEPDGRVSDEVSGRDLSRAIVVRRENLWAAQLDLPAGVGRDRPLEFALEWVEPSGPRWSWPRRMLPWQREPARAAIDLSAWDGQGD